VKLTPVAPPPAGTSDFIVSIVHTAAIVMAIASVAVAGKATNIVIQLYISNRESSVRPELSLASQKKLEGSAGAGKRPPTTLMSESSTVSELSFASCRVQVSPTPSPLDERIPEPSVLVALNRIVTRVGPETASLPVCKSELGPSRTNRGHSDDSYSEACHPITIS